MPRPDILSLQCCCYFSVKHTILSSLGTLLNMVPGCEISWGRQKGLRRCEAGQGIRKSPDWGLSFGYRVGWERNMEAGWRETRYSSRDHLGVLILSLLASSSVFVSFSLSFLLLLSLSLSLSLPLRLCLSLCRKAWGSYLPTDIIRIPDPLLGERAWGMILCKYGIMLPWCKKRMEKVNIYNHICV